jgi:hypothetical protein
MIMNDNQRIEKLLESWYYAEKNRGGLSHCYDGYDDGIAQGLKNALLIFGFTNEQLDKFYIEHK